MENLDKKKEYMKKWREANKERIKASRKAYYLKNIEKDVEYRKQNKDKIKQYYQDNKESYKKYHEANKDKIKDYNTEYKSKNKDKIKQYGKSEKAKAYQKKWREANKERIKENKKVRHNTDNLFRLKSNIRSLIYKSFKRINKTKRTKTFIILGCTNEQFKEHLESKFESWMNWDNYGKYNGTPDFGWDIDHINPLSSATCEDDIIKLNHYTNLQPLCSYTNRVIKHSNQNPQTQNP